MEIKKILVTGDDRFINRHHFLFEAMSGYVNQLDYLLFSNLYENSAIESLRQLLYKVIYKFSISTADRLFYKNQRTFIAKSHKLESKIRHLPDTPDLVFHVFCACSPFWSRYDIPYVMYLDYTMALAVKNWSPWAPFINDKERNAWIDCERQTYQKAHHLFTMSNVAKRLFLKKSNGR